jgi:hypothetical protein
VREAVIRDTRKESPPGQHLRLYIRPNGDWDATLGTVWPDRGDMGPKEAWAGLRIYRDDLRNGWHVVPAGVRYVAVQGVKAGQWSWAPPGWSEREAHESAAAMNRIGDKGPRGLDKPQDMPDRWCVLDLHDLIANHPRFMVKPAAEMREGEPCHRFTHGDVDRGHPFRNDDGSMSYRMNYAWRDAEERDRRNDPKQYQYACAVVDTHSPEWKAFQGRQTPKTVKHEWRRDRVFREMHCSCGTRLEMDDDPAGGFRRAPAGDCRYALEAAWSRLVPARETTTTTLNELSAAIGRTLKGMTWTECAVDEPKGPSDAEIVEIHGWTLNEIPTPMPVGWTYEEGSPSWRDRVYSLRGHRVTRQEREAAWSRELKRRSEATKEAERRGVLGPIDDPEHA